MHSQKDEMLKREKIIDPKYVSSPQLSLLVRAVTSMSTSSAACTECCPGENEAAWQKVERHKRPNGSLHSEQVNRMKEEVSQTKHPP